MAAHYNLRSDTLQNRLKNNWPLKKALLTPAGCKSQCTDHLGQVYANQSEMCKAHHIAFCTYKKNIQNGMSLKDALTSKKDTTVFDHLGNSYPSQTAMCMAYGINQWTFLDRIERGDSLEDALTRPLKTYFCTDHLGKTYKSRSAMARAYGIDPDILSDRLNEQKWSLEKALTTPVGAPREELKVKDHLGNEYLSIKEMAKAYKIPLKCLEYRLRNKMPLEEALMLPVDHGNAGSKPCKDHLGNEFKSMVAMARYYGKSPKAISACIKSGGNLKKLLAEDRIAEYTDHLGNIFASKSAMLKHYQIAQGTFDNIGGAHS
ncbi:hypothetical protein bpr_II400 (plasmid) [Butyrivibrio proteoclasticus B316]|uniref:Uncharacterized protein n=1 Tax=Butyrivibrio proteoclasticus (strain ATCC 51982 / DSM 14932 / B316) TaxID=515622 RepID=E0S4K5_BUTPB|nr:hypothetical protein [Butyrivibrio proteoclasticus]ADL36337.1 hypothetical protein bpr_II400 [Butyrivibrio proteoclasticus B316]